MRAVYGELIMDAREWINGKGRKIFAGIRSVTAGQVLLVLPTGKTVSHPLFKLSAGSQEKIAKLTGN
jgi:hypothetical protein